MTTTISNSGLDWTIEDQRPLTNKEIRENTVRETLADYYQSDKHAAMRKFDNAAKTLRVVQEELEARWTAETATAESLADMVFDAERRLDAALASITRELKDALKSRLRHEVQAAAYIAKAID